ncbi:MAG: DUF2752 domain-containing protein [Defluviitaleaceae bacterium]|nr:DUF2752 domain-containing protein [Defluviitaleaceae bacterium]
MYVVFLAMGGIALVVSLLTNFSICIFYRTTGVPCPSCGMTRAFRELFIADIAGAFWYHPLFFLVPLLPLLIWEKTPKFLSSVLLGVFLVVWVVRLVLFFPHTYPMTFNPNSLFGLVRSLIFP